MVRVLKSPYDLSHVFVCVLQYFLSWQQPSGRISGTIGQSLEKAEGTSGLFFFFLPFVKMEPEKLRPSSRSGSTSKRAIFSSSRPSYSVEPNESHHSRTSRVFSSGSRPSGAQRVQQPIADSRSSSAAVRGSSRNEPLLRSLEHLSLGLEKRK
ncbi:hypothetical protein B296_00050372 [Ensete ventricosum]|uniref:Uncharacterized protein n=1 Tax=Ensete ventricosum TaxID=4639 RepID=A0A426Y031_ENSVE|nr:hypothetical protein B296_00050372 [Ensete ventricosum]